MRKKSMDFTDAFNNKDKHKNDLINALKQITGSKI